MVDPISIAAFSGLSALGGLIVGKLTNRSKVDLSNDIFKDMNPEEIQFLAVKEEVDPDVIFQYVKQGKAVFVNFNKLLHSKPKLNQFLEKLSKHAKEENLRINHVAQDMVFISSAERMVHVTKLDAASKLPRKLEIDDIGAF
jgi:SepF-like predicted cell division protein (DUF552 family)